MTRRRFLRSAGIGAVGLWAARGTGLASAASAAAGASPPEFPAGIEVYRETYENWSGDIRAPDVWTCAPRTAADVASVANWAFRNGFRVRARGMRHGWSPLTIPAGDRPPPRVMLVDTTRHLNAMGAIHDDAVTAQAGASMGALLEGMHAAGLGFTSVPSTGEITVGGVLAVNGHGSAVPARGERRDGRRSYGSLSNRVRWFRAVVWERRSSRYVLRSFDRSHPDAAAFLTHLGRAFVTDVALRPEPERSLRCVSHVDIPAGELLAMPGSSAAAGRTYRRLVDEAGRIEVIWYAFTENPWVKVWSVAPTRPASARIVSGPYNYPFSDNIPAELGSLADRVVKSSGSLTPQFGRSMYAATVAGLQAFRAYDLWGASKDLLQYVRPSTIRVAEFGFAVVTRRCDVQRVVAEFAAEYQRRLASEASRGRFPVNVGIQIRSTGLDDPADVAIRGATAPSLSALRPRSDHPEWDTAVWFNVLTFPETAGANAFCTGLERWAARNYTGSYGSVRPEWSKGWAFTDRGAWTDASALGERIPGSFRAGHADGEGWDGARERLHRHDPHRIFTNPLLDALLR